MHDWRYELWRRRKVLWVIGIALFVVCCFCVWFILFRDMGTPVGPLDEPSMEVAESMPVEESPVASVDVPLQKDMVQCYRFVFDSLSDVGSKCYLTGHLLGGSEEEVTLMLTLGSQLVWLHEDGSITDFMPLDLVSGSVLTVYTFDTLSQGVPEIEVLVSGDASMYSMGVFKESSIVSMGASGKEVQVWLSSSSTDMVCIDSAVIRSGPFGALLSELNSPNVGGYFLYSRALDFDVTSVGNIYYAEDVIVFGLG